MKQGQTSSSTYQKGATKAVYLSAIAVQRESSDIRTRTGRVVIYISWKCTIPLTGVMLPHSFLTWGLCAALVASIFEKGELAAMARSQESEPTIECFTLKELNELGYSIRLKAHAQGQAVADCFTERFSEFTDNLMAESDLDMDEPLCVEREQIENHLHDCSMVTSIRPVSGADLAETTRWRFLPRQKRPCSRFHSCCIPSASNNRFTQIDCLKAGCTLKFGKRFEDVCR